jgi:excisionase family DNA binding protein
MGLPIIPSSGISKMNAVSSPPPAEADAAGMYDAESLARLLKCSTRTIYRLCDAGRMPRPIKLGALVRWPRALISEWIATGCPSCHEATPKQAPR